MNVCAIIPAGGQGTRMGGTVPKQFLALMGKPILHYTLKTFQESGLIDSLILVVPEKELEHARADWLEHPAIVKQVIAGGKTLYLKAIRLFLLIQTLFWVTMECGHFCQRT